MHYKHKGYRVQASFLSRSTEADADNPKLSGLIISTELKISEAKPQSTNGRSVAN